MSSDSDASEVAFEAAIRDQPNDRFAIDIYADWLEERFDDRARFLRGNRFCQHCLPRRPVWRSAMVWSSGKWRCPDVPIELGIHRVYSLRVQTDSGVIDAQAMLHTIDWETTQDEFVNRNTYGPRVHELTARFRIEPSPTFTYSDR